MKTFAIKHKNWVLLLIIMVGLAAYLTSITKASLWYDESVEYFYSKEPVGEVPGGLGTTNMYERVKSTFQPPLYNALMYVWLLLFDFGEFSFRLAGVLVTLLGAVGLYKCLEKLCGELYGFLGTILYIFTASVAYYALECAEYNLMLCCICWMLFFFVKYIKEKTLAAMVGFFVFASASVYSQYGAAFLVVTLYIFLAASCVKNKKHLMGLAICTFVTLLTAVLPLVVLFTLPQMANQGTLAVSHMPAFKDNLVVDYIKGVLVLINRFFRLTQGTIGYISDAIVCGAIVLTAAALLKRDAMLSLLAVACVIVYSLYFAALECSFYGYNDWAAERVGFSNIAGRYSLFFVPLVIMTLIYGLSVFMTYIKKPVLRNALKTSLAAAAAFFCLIEIFTLFVGWTKSSTVREAAKIWYEVDAYEKVTLVHQWTDANFQFYIRHDDRYQEAFQDNIIAADLWIREASRSEMEDWLEESGVLGEKMFYYVGRNNETCDAFVEAVEENGYSVTELHKDKSVLLCMEKQ